MTRLKGRGIELGLGDDLEADDPRRATAIAVMQEADTVRPDIVALFAGMPLATDQRRLDELIQSRALINEQWGKVKDSFLTIGRALVRIERMLSPEEYRRFCSEMGRIMPFSGSNASKFRLVAVAVDEGRLPERQLPASFATAYELSTINAAGLKLAASRQLIRPDVDRAAVVAFKRDLKKGLIIEGFAEPGEGASKVSIIALRRDRDRIQREIDRLDDRRNLLVQELAEAEARIAEAKGAE